MVSADYLRWLASLPVNRGASRRSWTGVYTTEQSFLTFEQWQVRMSQRDAQRGVIARWLRWLNS